MTGYELMKDDIAESTKDLRGWVVRVRRGQAADLLRKITEEARRSGGEVLVVKAELVFGLDHMRAAMYHARRAIDERRNASDSLAMETLLYASGERQLSTAISKMSADEDTEEVAVVSLGGTPPKTDRDWGIMPPVLATIDPERLRRFGISEREIGTISPERGAELVLEKVAAVDILKK